MEDARRDLARMRESREAWQELRYERVGDHDANEVRRAKVLWALQYDRGPDDLALLRWLAEQEAACRAEAPFQGLGEQAELVGFLLAEHAQPEDVWRHHAIKRANFDTGCGYDREHLVAAGVGATIEHVRESDHPDRDDVLELLLDDEGEPEMSEEDLTEWLGHRREWFPADPADEDPLTWFGRAMLVGDPDIARAELDRWASGRPRDEGTLSLLRYHLTELGAFAEAAEVQRESLTFATGDWDRASAWQTLGGLERQAGDHRAAWEALRECRRALDGVDGWQELGMGRGLVHELFLLAGVAEHELADEVLAEAERQARDVPRLPPVVTQAAEVARRR